MADNADIANDLIQDRLQQALANRPKPPAQASAHECLECGDPIPEGRRNAIKGVTLCISCAEDKRRKSMHYRR